jgi:hypothetical protein
MCLNIRAIPRIETQTIDREPLCVEHCTPSGNLLNRSLESSRRFQLLDMFGDAL